MFHIGPRDLELLTVAEFDQLIAAVIAARRKLEEGGTDV